MHTYICIYVYMYRYVAIQYICGCVHRYNYLMAERVRKELRVVLFLLPRGSPVGTSRHLSRSLYIYIYAHMYRYLYKHMRLPCFHKALSLYIFIYM